MCSTDHNKVWHTSQQCNCRDMCIISLWLVEHISNQSTSKFGLISNLIEILLEGRGPGPYNRKAKCIYFRLTPLQNFLHTTHNRRQAMGSMLASYGVRVLSLESDLFVLFVSAVFSQHHVAFDYVIETMCIRFQSSNMVQYSIYIQQGNGKGW